MTQIEIFLKAKQALVIADGWGMTENPKTPFYQQLKKVETAIQSLDWPERSTAEKQKERFTITEEETAFVFDAIGESLKLLWLLIESAFNGAKDQTWNFYPEAKEEDLEFTLEEFLQEQIDYCPGRLQETLQTLYSFTQQVHPKPEEINLLQQNN
jgi:hypothetical protein